jgi:hypothetical protein
MSDPYLMVSSDSHAGPSLEAELRPYCPAAHLDDFDAYGALYRAAIAQRPDPMVQDVTAPALAAYEDLLRCEGLHDPHAFLRDMDAEGIAAQVIFAGGGNKEPLPWSDGFNAGDPRTAPALRAVGGHIWNQWPADFASVAPERLLGVMHIPIWDLPAAIEELAWGKAHSLRAVNFPAPRPDYPDYQRHEIGLGTLLWGADYPHVEGTWPRTELALRNTFAGLPVDEVRAACASDDGGPAGKGRVSGRPG